MQQPEPQSLPYDVLLNDIEKGLVKIPRFQREFVWSREKSAALLDSVLRGYPIGTFILWRTRESLRAVRNIGHAKLPATPDGEYANQVLDGQQRLTSLFAAIRGLKVDRGDGVLDDFSEVRVDLEANEDEPFVVVNDGTMPQQASVRVVDLVGQSFKFFGRFDEKYHDRIERMQQRLKSYLFSVILVKDAPIEVATEIFTRINEGGKPLTPFEIMVAKTYVEKKFDLSERCEKLLEELRDAEFETVPEIVFLQVAAVLLRKECRKKVILSLAKEAFVASWPHAEGAIRHAVDYVKTAYRIPASRLLPYPAMLVPIAYWFHHHKGKPTGIAADRLRAVFWRIGIESSYSSSLESGIAQDIKRVDQILQNQTPTYSEPVKPVSENDIRDYGYFSTGRAFVRTILCMFAARRPESFDDGSQVIVDNDWLIQANSKNYHHFFPRAHLKRKGFDDREANHVANITIIDDRLNKRVIRDKPPSLYLASFKQNKKLKETLRTHLISLDKDGVLEDDYEKFLRARCRSIAKEIRKLVEIKDEVSAG